MNTAAWGFKVNFGVDLGILCTSFGMKTEAFGLPIDIFLPNVFLIQPECTPMPLDSAAEDILRAKLLQVHVLMVISISIIL